MESRRDFLKKAALLSGLGGMYAVMPESVARAFAINPPLGTTYLDAEHVVILMQGIVLSIIALVHLQVCGDSRPPLMTQPDRKRSGCRPTKQVKRIYLSTPILKTNKATWMGRCRTDGRIRSMYATVVVVINGYSKKSGGTEYRKCPLTPRILESRGHTFL